MTTSRIFKICNPSDIFREFENINLIPNWWTEMNWEVFYVSVAAFGKIILHSNYADASNMFTFSAISHSVNMSARATLQEVRPGLCVRIQA